MIVKVVPVRPIHGILPKNKWLDTEMVLDLNKNEIVYCMQFGNVYDEDGKLIDAISVHQKAKVNPKTKAVEIIETVAVEPVIVKEVPEVATVELTTTENDEPMVIEAEQEPISEPVAVYTEVAVEEEKEEPKYFNLEVSSCVKEDEYIILTTQMNTNSKLEGNLYGLFNVTSGTRPVVEYKLNDEWVKINNKFANFTKIENEDKFVFRFTPKNENEFSYKIVIKEANEVLTKLEEKINPANL
jgi:hypothetical protein